MRLYRVEMMGGEGPYRSVVTHLANIRCGWEVPCVDDGVPTPWQEGLKKKPWPVTKFGFAFNDQLNRWFAGKWFERLAPFGFGVGEYTIDARSTLVTPTQALYNGRAKSLKRIRWTPLDSVIVRGGVK